jgi:nucleotide-binding universal stress UspA family protein
MFSRILVATDLSEASDCVIGSLGALRAWGAKEVVLVHCLNLCEPSMVTEQLKGFAEPYLSRQADALERQGLKTLIEVAPGLSQVEINRIAEDQECSLVVVGSHGKTKSSQILLGGVASEVIRTARKPVLLVRLNLRQERDRAVCGFCQMAPAGPVLFPTDFSTTAELAFATLKNIVAAGPMEVTLLHVQDQSTVDKSRLEECNRADEERLAGMKRALEQIGATRVHVELTYGVPAREILARVQDSGFAWVVMGSQGRGYISEIFLGSISHKVARHSQIPVLLIPAKR